MDDKPKIITVADLDMNNLSEYIHTKVGEASTLFYDNDEHIFNEQRALNIAGELIAGITKLVDEAKA